MTVVGINGSPRKNGNTAQMLDRALDGAMENGAKAERIDLFDLSFTGCKSCFACKLKSGGTHGHCALKDELSPVLDRVLAADALIAASPVYFGDVTGLMRCFFERLWFPSLMYSPDGKTAFDKHLRVGLIYTMNVEDPIAYGYGRLFEQNEDMFGLYIGKAETLFAADTIQFSDYSKYHSDIFDPEHKLEVHNTRFPQELNRAFELGKKLTR